MSDKWNPEPYGKPILCLDFDGCIHSYKSGWQGVDVIRDPPVPGVFEWIKKAMVLFEIHIYSSRSSESRGRFAMQQYFADNGAEDLLNQIIFAHEKPRAFLTIDDRCVPFMGDWSDPLFNPELLRIFQPWYKLQK